MEGGGREGLIVIGRKVAMNHKTNKLNHVGRAFLVTRGILAVVFYVSVWLMNVLKGEYPMLFQLFAGIILEAFI